MPNSVQLAQNKLEYIKMECAKGGLPLSRQHVKLCCIYSVNILINIELCCTVKAAYLDCCSRHDVAS